MADALPAELSKVDPADAWAAWTPSDAVPWDRKWVAHLYRRAAFGPSPADTDRALAVGPDKTLDRLLAGEPNPVLDDDLLTYTGDYSKDPSYLRGWWLYAMAETGHPLREKLTLFWHNHFATSYSKVRLTTLMLRQNQLLRKHALGEFRPFLLDMSRDTAMLVWLDSNRNVKGAPNENYAREVMELFSLGVGNYTEKDVQEAARAFTGWHHDPEVERFEYNADLHDDGPKTVFGKTGPWNGDDVVTFCCDQPACARFLVGKLYAFLVSETPPPKGLLAPLEDRLRASDYDIADLVRAMLGSRLFFSEHAYRKRVKWPVEFALGAVRAVVPARGPDPLADWVPLADLKDPLSKMGQALFAPPNVKGWRTGTDWLNSATLLARNNFAETVATGAWSRAPYRPGGGKPVATAVTKKSATKGAPGSESPPPAPPPEYDVAETLFAAKPADVPAVVTRAAVLLYGEDLPPAARRKIESFLSAGAGKSVDSPAFRQKAREAVHALMCLPEYQLC
ncbi:MAG: DUF1800 domain-containing protein [Gemmataceae bacterium]|nr:DUF1800 domain-containing protein [Gemmataceae bacterium]